MPPKCDVAGCEAGDKVFKTPAALGSHKKGAHGIAGKSYDSKKRRKASRPRHARGLPAKARRRAAKKAPERAAALELARDASNGTAFVHALKEKAREYHEKARQLELMAEQVRELF